MNDGRQAPFTITVQTPSIPQPSPRSQRKWVIAWWCAVLGAPWATYISPPFDLFFGFLVFVLLLLHIVASVMLGRGGKNGSLFASLLGGWLLMMAIVVLGASLIASRQP